MTRNEDPETVAAERLQELGLSSYAARTFVALAGLGSGTAKDVSEVSEVPRTRVYDAVEELGERGLVDVRQSNPKLFWPVSSETVARTFEHEFQQRVATLTTALGELEPVDRRDEQRGVWTVDGREAVTTRVVEFLAGAEEEVVYMTVEGLLTGAVLDELRAAADRGVEIHLGSNSQAVEERIREAVPAAETFQSLWVWSDTPAGRLMMVDGSRTLVSVRMAEDGDAAADGGETAIWGSGETNSLVVVLRAIFTWRLEGSGP